MLSPPSSKKLSSMPTRATPSTSANSPHRISSCGVRGARCACCRAKLRRRQRAPVELAVRRQRQPIQHHQRRRHHVLRQHLRQRRTKPHSINRGQSPASAALPPPHSRPAAAPDPPSARATTTACDTPACRSSEPRSRQARSGTRAASPARPPAPETPAPRRHATAPGPRSGTSARPPTHAAAMRVGHKPLRRQTRTLSDSPAPDQRPQCKAHPQPPKAQAPNNRPKRKPDNAEEDDQSGRARAPFIADATWRSHQSCFPSGHTH